MNEYLYDSLDAFVRQLEGEYSKATDKFVSDWKKCLRGYIRRIEAAKVIVSDGNQMKIDKLIKELNVTYKKVEDLMSEEQEDF